MVKAIPGGRVTNSMGSLSVSYPSKIFLYGPPGCGKSTIGRLLAHELKLPFWDLDDEIQRTSQMEIPEIFRAEGEAGFRRREVKVLEGLLAPGEAVIALGGGALLDAEVRSRVEAHGKVIFLDAHPDLLLQRLQESGLERPLLNGDPAANLERLLESRASHYASFENRLTVGAAIEESVWQAQIATGYFRVRGMGEAYDVRVISGGLAFLGEGMLQRGLVSPVALVSDTNVAPLYALPLTNTLRASGYQTIALEIPSGEQHKTLKTIQDLWRGMVAGGLERGSTVMALGGGVVGDLAGFAAATYMRGIPWVTVPTSLLAMVDASLGGKTGADLAEGKNLIGAFHAPRLVLADPQTLGTLLQEELRSGMAEVVKHAVITDPQLFELCIRAQQLGENTPWEEIVRRAMAVKIAVIQADPYEKGARATLNLGHTVGHALEAASGYKLRHGEAVSIGMVIAARLAERIGLAETGLSAQIASVLAGIGLPTIRPRTIAIPEIIERMRVDKKRAGGKLRFALPRRIGEVVFGVEVDADDIPWEA